MSETIENNRTQRDLENRFTIEIVDEAGNTHGPFTSREEAFRVADDRALGEQNDNPDDERAPGWSLRMTRTAS